MTIKDTTQQVRTVLLQHWDPIGIVDEPAAQDEYDSYAPAIAGMLLAGASTENLADHLLAIERDSMGLAGDPVRALRTAELLVALSE